MDNSDRAAFIPSKLDIAALLAIAAALLISLNFKQILAFLSGEEVTDIEKQVFPLIQDFLLDKLSAVTANAATFLFWLGIGFVVLIIIDVLWNLAYLYRSDMPQKSLLRPKDNGFEKKDVYLHLFARSVSLIGLLGWFIWLFIGVIPFCNKLFLDGLEINQEVYKALLAITLTGAYLYVAGVLMRFILLRRRLFRS